MEYRKNNIYNIKWGNKFVDNLSIDLKLEFSDITGFSPRNIRYMRKFADEYQDEKFLQEVLAKITWYHNIILMDKVKDIEHVVFSSAEFVNQILIKMLKIEEIEEIEEKYWLSVIKNVIINIIIKIRD